MKIYTITPGFDERIIDRIKAFFDCGHELLQLRDKYADMDETCRFIETVKKVSSGYDQAKLILNFSNNFELNGEPLVDLFELAGIQQSTANNSDCGDFCPSGKFNILSCHSEKDIKLAKDAGFSAATLSPVYYTLSHPEQTKVLGIDEFSRICIENSFPVFALGGVNLDMMAQFSKIENCAGIAVIRGWFGK